MKKDIIYINNGLPLEWDEDGFAIPPAGGDAFFAGDWINVLLSVVGTGSVILYGSTQKNIVKFSAPSESLNMYAPIVLADYSTSQVYYDGATGVTVSDQTKIVEANTNLLTWVAIKRTGTPDVILTVTNIQ